MTSACFSVIVDMIPPTVPRGDIVVSLISLSGVIRTLHAHESTAIHYTGRRARVSIAATGLAEELGHGCRTSCTAAIIAASRNASTDSIMSNRRPEAATPFVHQDMFPLGPDV